MPKKLDAVIADKGVALGIILGIDSGLTAEALGRAGFDFLFIDQQHGAVDDAVMLRQVQAAQAAGCVALVRPPWSEPAGIMKAIDYGADGIIAPLIDGPGDAAGLVSAMRYPPVGKRSFGPIRAGLPDVGAYTAAANDSHSAIAMIETASAFENLDAILATPGLDGVLIGPNDLSFALDCYGESPIGTGKFAQAVRHVAERATEAGVTPGIHCGDPDTARVLRETGFKFLSISADLSLLFTAGQAAVEAMREV